MFSLLSTYEIYLLSYLSKVIIYAGRCSLKFHINYIALLKVKGESDTILFRVQPCNLYLDSFAIFTCGSKNTEK